MSYKKAKRQRMAHNKKTSNKKANSSTSKKRANTSKQHKPSREKAAEQIARQEEKAAAAEKKTKAMDFFKNAGIIAVCVILVLALGLPATIFAFNSGTQTVAEDTTSQTTLNLSKQQHKFLEDSGMFEHFLTVDSSTGLTLTDVYGGTATHETMAFLADIEASGDTPASRLVLPANMVIED